MTQSLFVGNSANRPSDRVWYAPVPKERYETVLPGVCNLLYSVLVRANTLELSVHRSIYCIFYIFGILWSTMSDV